MIKSIKTKSIALYWFKSQRLDVPAKAAKKLKVILKLLNTIKSDTELFDTFKSNACNLQKYKEWGEGAWEIRVSGNWRLIFRWDGVDVTDLTYTDETH